MHRTYLRSKNYQHRKRLQEGFTLVLSLLLVAILTMLSMTAMQSSVLSYKNQNSRTGYQKNISELNQIQFQSALKIKDYIDGNGGVVDGGEHLSEGFQLLTDILANTVMETDKRDNDESKLSPLLSYTFPHIQIDVYIAQGRLSKSFLGDDLQQFNAYEVGHVGRLKDKQYLYLQLHCIGKSKGPQSHGSTHLVGDFRFEVAS